MSNMNSPHIVHSALCSGCSQQKGHCNFLFFTDYLAAMGEPGGGRNEVDPRFISMFSVYNVTFPSSETLDYIYTNILSGHLQTFPKEVQTIEKGLVQLTLELYEVISRHIAPVYNAFV